ncbi:amidohydrolase family protein [Paractinoplanes atraurantiacus]|uniref:amidohydrolase family protein n=1 Tax=Paractinoplanes atraurantiacus TaxID=1036182 RepID=UPI0015CF008E|nr:amidohydrolase family protein [Actinoplanes atraurantiacus]
MTRGESILAVAADDAVPREMLDAAQIVDLPGRYLLPGLVDAHQHIATPPDRPAAERMLRRALRSGITLVRIMGDDLRQVADLARASLVGQIDAPDLRTAALFAGPSFFTDPRTVAACAGAVPGEVPWMQAITEDTDLGTAVAMARGTGAAAIKIYADLPKKLVTAVAEEAHRQGLGVWAHAAVFPAGPRDLVEAPADVMSHATLLAYEGVAVRSFAERATVPIEHARFRGGDDPAVRGVLDAMRRRGTILDATGSLLAHAEGFDEDDARTTAALVRQAHRAGVPICAGTDYETAVDDPYPALHEEIEYLVERAGMTAAEAIRAATLIGARAAGEGDRRGSVESEKLADLVVLARDPYADVRNLRSVEMTVKRGRVRSRDDLAECPVTAPAREIEPGGAQVIGEVGGANPR